MGEENKSHVKCNRTDQDQAEYTQSDLSVIQLKAIP